MCFLQVRRLLHIWEHQITSQITEMCLFFLNDLEFLHTNTPLCMHFLPNALPLGLHCCTAEPRRQSSS